MYDRASEMWCLLQRVIGPVQMALPSKVGRVVNNLLWAAHQRFFRQVGGDRGSEGFWPGCAFWGATWDAIGCLSWLLEG